MGYRSIGATLSLNNGNFFTNMKSAVSATGGLKSALGSANGALKSHNTMASAAGNTLKSLAGKVLGVVAAYASINAIKNFGMECIEAANAQTEAEKRLETTMSNVKGTTMAQIESVKKYAAELQGLTTVGDEVSIMGASQLATFQLQSDTIKKLMPSLNDLAVAQFGVTVSGDQMKQMANLVGKVMTGNVSSLSRYGVIMDDTQKKILQTGTESQRAAMLVDVLSQNFGGLAEAMANTPAGRVQQLKNAWADMQEVIGAQLYPAVTKALTWMTTQIPAVQSTLTGLTGALQPAFDWVATTAIPAIGSAIGAVISIGADIYNACLPALTDLGAAFSGLGTAISTAFASESASAIRSVAQSALPVLIDVVSGAVNVVSFLVSNFDKLAPVLGVVAAAVVAYNTAVKIQTALDTARTGVTALLTASGVANTATLTAMTGAEFAHTAAASAGAVATWALNSALAVLTSPITLVIAAIAAVVAIFVVLWKKCDGFRNFFIGLWDKIKTIVSAAWEHIKATLAPLIDAIKGAFQAAWEAVKVIWEYVKPYFQAVWKSIQAVFSVVKTYIGGAFKVAFTIIKAVWDTVVGYFTAIWNTIKGIFSAVKAVFSGDFKGAWEAIKGIFAAWGDYFKGLWDSIVSIFSAIGSWFSSTFSAAWDAIKNIFSAWGEFFSGLWNGIVNVFSAIGSWFAGIFTAAWNGIKAVFAGVGAFFQGIWNGIVSIFSTIGTAIGTFFQNAWQTIQNVFMAWTSFFQGLWDGLVGIFSAVGDWFIGIFTSAWDGICNVFAAWTGFFSGLWNGVVGVFSSVASWFGSIFSGAWEAVKNAFLGVVGFFQGIWNSIKSMFTKIGTSIAEGVSGAFKSVINAVIGFAEGLINKFIGGVNAAIGVINAIPGVNIPKLQTVSFPKLAKGGIVTASTIAEVGEAGDEAVLPLSQFWNKLERFISDSRKQEYTTNDRSRTSNNITVNVYTNNQNDTDMAEKVATVILDKLNNM